MSQNDDGDGSDDRICMLPAYYGGNTLDDDICGYWQTPRNLGYRTLTASVGGAPAANIGFLFSYMDLMGTWRGTLQLRREGCSATTMRQG
jgi:hypothetical protein